MYSTLDISFVALAALQPLLLHVAFPQRVQQMAAVAGGRLKLYRQAMLRQWIPSLLLLALWSHEGHGWSALGLTPPQGGRLPLGLALIAAALLASGIAEWRRRRISRTEARAKLQKLLSASAAEVLPRNRQELRWFHALSVTAGICEELIFRGAIAALLVPVTGLFAAYAIGVAAFGIGHAYQGPRGIAQTAMAGVAASGIVWLSGWLIPAMILHALVDINTGRAGYHALAEDPHA